jgi:hypothetical protein
MGENKVMRISRQPSPTQSMLVQKQLESVGSLITINAIYIQNKSFHQQIGLKSKEETNEMLHLEHNFSCAGNVRRRSVGPIM